MKKKLLVLIILLLAITLVGCSKKETEEEAKNNSGVEYTYTEGVLTQIVDDEGTPKQNEFVINGISLLGNRHDYEDIKFKKTGINSSFYLNEYIGVYLDTDYNKSNEDIKIYVIPKRTVEEIDKMNIDKLQELAEEKGAIIEYNTPDEENNKFVGEGYVNMDNPIGKYELLFLYKNKLAYFISLDLEKEEP